MDKKNLLENIVEFNNKSRPQIKEGKGKQGNAYESANALYEGQKLNQILMLTNIEFFNKKNHKFRDSKH